MSLIIKSFLYGNKTITMETGRLARQATAAVLMKMGDTTVLVTVVGVPGDSSEQDFFPLTVNYQERAYAGGRIPGGFFKREGKPTERETLISRLIDRPIRPLFPEGFKNEVQVIATVLSAEADVESDVLSMLGASAALAISGLPFRGPIGAARVGYRDGAYLLNPSNRELQDSQLDLVVAGTAKAVLMVESEAKELSEEVMLGAVYFGHEQMQVAINAINDFAQQVGKAPWAWQAPLVDEQLKTAMVQEIGASLAAAYQIHEKTRRLERVNELREQIVAKFCTADSTSPDRKFVKELFHDLEKSIVRRSILTTNKRIDGRDTRTVRPISISIGELPRVHGSAVFTRGETQALVAATLGTEKDAQLIDNILNEQRDTFMLHYNFPPYCVGETGSMSGPKRREIGHGRLARRAINPILPTADQFPYVLRVVSEITESNGSSSMATVCGASLALMDAGVPIKAPVAGVAMGLIKEDSGFAILTDILGDEDHLGDMDFKVAGTHFGITALQMDIKTDGITRDIMKVALHQAQEARLHILGEMSKALPLARAEVSVYAPRIITMQIPVDKIRDVIGKGGVVIRALTEETGTTIDISDSGVVKIASVDSTAGQECLRRITELVAEVELGKIYEGKVAKLLDFGALVNFLNGKQGLVHISQICDERVEKVEDKLTEGQSVRVRVIEIDRMGRIRLSIKQAGETSF